MYISNHEAVSCVLCAHPPLPTLINTEGPDNMQSAFFGLHTLFALNKAGLEPNGALVGIFFVVWCRLLGKNPITGQIPGLDPRCLVPLLVVGSKTI